MTTPAIGLVLAGGAARGAYQAGVMRFVFCDLARRLGRPTWPEIVSGTSVGSINGLFAAARSQAAIEDLSLLWQTLTIDRVYALYWSNLVAAVRSTYRAEQHFALLDPQPLYQLVRERFPAGLIQESIDSGACRALILSATELETGYNKLFVDTALPRIPFKPAPGGTARKVRITARHALASSALPLLFPSVDIDGGPHVDGGLRQNTPLRPLLRAGARRALVVGVKQSKVREGATPLEDVTPNLPFLLGKTFNALMLDPVERDIENAEQVNQLLEWGARRYGPEFGVEAESELGLHPVDILFLRPREDLGRVAADVFRAHPPKVSSQVRWMLGFIADRANESEADLLSYLYFDKEYTGALEQLGYEDAAHEQEALARLFDPQVASP